MTIDERIEALTMHLELLTRDVDTFRATVVLQQADVEGRHDQHDREIAEIRGELRRAVRLAAIELRNQRRRTTELDEKITALASAQLSTEEKLQRLISSLERGRNGHD